MVRRDAADVRLLTRNGLDWSSRYPGIASAVGKLRCRSCLLDGEYSGQPIIADTIAVHACRYALQGYTAPLRRQCGDRLLDVPPLRVSVQAAAPASARPQVRDKLSDRIIDRGLARVVFEAGSDRLLDAVDEARVHPHELLARPGRVLVTGLRCGTAGPRGRRASVFVPRPSRFAGDVDGGDGGGDGGRPAWQRDRRRRA